MSKGGDDAVPECFCGRVFPTSDVGQIGEAHANVGMRTSGCEVYRAEDSGMFASNLTCELPSVAASRARDEAQSQEDAARAKKKREDDAEAASQRRHRVVVLSARLSPPRAVPCAQRRAARGTRPEGSKDRR